jgi:hypothetical protein
MLASLSSLLGSSTGALGAPGAHVIASKGSFLIKPGVGLMIWTLLVFGATMLLLRRFAFPSIAARKPSKRRSTRPSARAQKPTRSSPNTGSG